MAYSEVSDLLLGDIRLPARYGDGTGFINLAADEIDAQIGHIYETPIELDDSPENRPALLLLKKINNFLASGRIITDMAAAGEDRELHAYGWSLITQATALLNKLSGGEIVIPGATPLPGTEDQAKGPLIINEDEVSLVEDFYLRYTRPHIFQPPPAVPYRDPVV